QSDVYSLGVVCYELLTGTLPFIGSMAAVLRKILTDDPVPPRELVDGIDPDLEKICLKMMARDRSERYANMSAVAQALAEHLDRPDPTAFAVWASPATPRATSAGDAPLMGSGRTRRSDPSWTWLAGKMRALNQEKKEIEQLRGRGDAAGARQLLEAMAAIDHPGLTMFADWAQAELRKLQ
ncbi:MAG: hypothetical protein KY476_26235, partial [Planctomycetes bacterium]|nr:hypothetical protein [Planctomycetota bacterium]